MLPKQENLYIEFKSDLKKYPDSNIFEDVVAFANTSGGDLYLGIEDSGEVTGIHPSHKNPVALGAYIANHTVPPISVRAEIIDDIRSVLKISVPQSYSSVVATSTGKVLRRRLKADGTPENIPMFPAEFITRMSDLRMLDYSSMVLKNTSIDIFDLVEVERLKQIILSKNGEKSLLELSNLELYKALGLAREENEILLPTITGILLVGKIDAIKEYIPTATAAFQVLVGTDIRVNDDFTLPMLATIEKIDTYMAAWNPEIDIEDGLFRMPVPEFNKHAIREAVVNAFSHRDYTKMGRIRIMINDDGLTVSNPGTFIEGVNIKNLLSAEPHGRNPQLADTLKRIGLAERTGRGIDRIYEGSLLLGRPIPDYTASTSMNVSLFIPRSKPDVQLARLISNEQQRLGRPLSINTLLVLNALKDSPKSSIAQLSEIIPLSEIAIKSILDKSIESGLVDGYGSGRGRTYILSSKMYNAKNNRLGYVRQVDIVESRYLELVTNLAKSNEYISKTDVIDLLHVSGHTAYRILKILTQKNILTLATKGKYSKYQYIQK